MQIVEAKNNLVRISYDTSEHNLILSGFVSIMDANQSFIGQVINLDANQSGNFAIVKLLFNFNDEGIITSYNGAIPKIDNQVDIVQSQEILGILPVQNPVLFGDLAQQNTPLNLDISVFENKLLVCSEKSDDNEQLIENISSQLDLYGKKLIVFDLCGNLGFSNNKVIASENFKLPLNYESINFIYSGLDEASSETKAFIQEIFLEVQNYVKTLPEKFIPFESFKDVVDAQYAETELVELLLLKNKLLKYNEDGIFAQESSEFETIIESLGNPEATIFDLSKVDGNIQRQMISFVYSFMKESGQEYYAICNVDNDNSDKKLLKQIFTTKNVYSTLICPYAFKYLMELKQLSKNSILFAPIQQQSDFAAYNIFVNKLNPHEFVMYGQATHHIPFIVKLTRLSQSETESIEEEEFDVPVEESAEIDQTLDEEIKRDVDEFYTAPKEEIPSVVSPEILNEEFMEEAEEEFVPETVEEYGEEYEEEFVDESQDFQAVEEEQVSEESQLIEEDELTEDELDFLDDIDVNEDFIEEELLEEEGDVIEESEVQISSDETETFDQDTNFDDFQEFELEEEGQVESEEDYQQVYEEIPEETSEEVLEENYYEEPQVQQPSPFADFASRRGNESSIIQEEQSVFEQEEEFAEELVEESMEEPEEEQYFEPVDEPPVLDILPASMSSTPIVPIYSADVEPQVQSDLLEQGDVVSHPKYGRGTVEKLINYGSKTLCSINFDNVGRRLLDPNLAELKKV